MKIILCVLAIFASVMSSMAWAPSHVSTNASGFLVIEKPQIVRHPERPMSFSQACVYVADKTAIWFKEPRSIAILVTASILVSCIVTCIMLLRVILKNGDLAFHLQVRLPLRLRLQRAQLVDLHA